MGRLGAFFLATVMAVAAVTFILAATPLSAVPTAEAVIVGPIACDPVVGGQFPGQPAWKTCTVRLRGSCRVVTVSWVEENGDRSLNTEGEWQTLTHTIQPC